MTINFSQIIEANNRIKDFVKNTPVIFNKELNEELGAEIFFKMENLQRAKSFKSRGAFNAILAYRQRHGKFPDKIVVQSSGNHAKAVASAGKEFGIEVLVYMISKASPFKIAATKKLGAKVILLDKRSQVNAAAAAKQEEGYVLIHPFANEDVICGQATATFEALNQIGPVDAIFAPCGGGGLVSGAFLAAQELSPNAKVFGCEPENANDIAQSFRKNKIISFSETPNTIADGARTLSTDPICFEYIKKLSAILEIREEKIIFWQKKLSDLLLQKIEPTSALTIAATEKFLQEKSNCSDKSKQNLKILNIISGGNIV